MPDVLMPRKKKDTYLKLMSDIAETMSGIKPLTSRGDRPLQMSFEDQVNILIFFHLEEHHSGCHLLQTLKESDFARKHVAPEKGISKSSFFEDISSRGLEQMIELFGRLYNKAAGILPKGHEELGNLTIIDGSLIDATLSMNWADYRDNDKKAKVHLGFDLNHGIPRKVFLTDGKSDERIFASRIISPGETGVLDRYYQCHKNFDEWQSAGQHFICRIKASTRRMEIRKNDIKPGIVFYDAIVLLGTPHVNQTQKEVRLVGYRADNIDYWVATDRFDLSAEQVAFAYKLRWNIEIFFGWWKRHLKVYHLISRSKYGLMMQMLAGLITYILLAIYCHNEYREPVSVKRLREICIKIRNEESLDNIVNETDVWLYQPSGSGGAYAST